MLETSDHGSIIRLRVTYAISGSLRVKNIFRATQSFFTT